MPFKFSEKSVEKLNTVDPVLKKLVCEVQKISPIPFEISEGIRSLARQRQLIAEGKSKTLKSKHLLGQAIDFVPLRKGKWNFNGWESAAFIAGLFIAKSKELGIKIVSGALWWNSCIEDVNFRDHWHIQI